MKGEAGETQGLLNHVKEARQSWTNGPKYTMKKSDPWFKKLSGCVENGLQEKREGEGANP